MLWVLPPDFLTGCSVVASMLLALINAQAHFLRAEQEQAMNDVWMSFGEIQLGRLSVC